MIDTESKEYAELCFRAGWFAGGADKRLGGKHFSNLVRAERWTLTQAKLDLWKTEAMALGVPPEELVPGFDTTPMVETGMAAQKVVNAGGSVEIVGITVSKP